MKNITDGYGYVEVEGVTYELTPSFFNMAKLGSPKEIIKIAEKAFIGKSSVFDGKDMYKAYSCNVSIDIFINAIKILEACGINDEAGEVLGGIQINEWTGRTVIVPGALSVEDVLVLAAHCIEHGICGGKEAMENAGDEKSKVSSEKIDEFDVYTYIGNAIDHFNLTLDEAEGLTMTKFVRMIGAKIKISEQQESKKKDAPTKAEVKDAEDLHAELARKAHKKAMERLAKKRKEEV